MFVSIQGDGDGEIHERLRQYQSGAGQSVGQLRQCRGAASSKARVQIGSETIEADTPNLAGVIAAAVKEHGYPAGADPDNIN
jgi:hypothetical protein